MTFVFLAGGGRSMQAQRAVGDFEDHRDVGRVTHPGNVRYDGVRQSYRISGSGTNMWGAHDDFHFVWRRMTGNFILSTRAHFVGAGVEAHRKMGWTVRASLDADAAHVTAAVHGDGLASLQFRATSAAETDEHKSSVTHPDVVQLERRDGQYLMSVAQFGDTLVTTTLSGVSLPDTVYVGLFVCAHNDSVTEEATFDNVRLTTPAPSDFRPYRDYIGSRLEILDVADGHATVVHTDPGSFQAPNWTPDGRALFYAQDGRIVRFDVATRRTSVVPTGEATRNNNDHVLSFDGKWLGISHHTASDSGASNVYTLPAARRNPRHASRRADRRTFTAGPPTGDGSSSPGSVAVCSTSTRSLQLAATRSA